MEVYRDSYIVALMVNGKIQKESDDGSVLIPFGSEYVLRLKNKLRKRAVADVWIDGKVAAKGIVIDANGTVDLERFVADGNLSEGKRFKLARLTDPKVDQPNDSENGIIEVNFYPEKDAPVVEKIVEHHDYWDFNHYPHNHNWIGHCHQCCNNNWCSICHPNIFLCKTTTTSWDGLSSGSITVGNNITGGDFNKAFQGGVTGNIPMNASFSTEASMMSQVTSNNLDLSKVVNCSSLGEAAATVEGSTSSQKFSSISIDVDRSKPTTIRLTVKGLSKVLEVCSACGYKRKKDVKYCPYDATQLVA